MLNRKALLLAIVTEVVLFTMLLVSIEHCRPLMVALRIIHAPAAGWCFFLTDWLDLPLTLNHWLSGVLGFCVQTFIWYALLCRITKVRDGALVV